MDSGWNRRRVIKQLIAVAGTLAVPAKRVFANSILGSACPECEIQISSVSANTVRLSILPIQDGVAGAISMDGSLVQSSWGAPLATLRGDWQAQPVNAGDLTVHAAPDPLTFTITTKKIETIQQLVVDRESGVVHFQTGHSPILGLGEGGPQFDRRGSVDKMISGQGGYRLETHGGRVPIPWIIGTEGWALYFHQPFGTFDFNGAQSRFEPAARGGPIPLDIFLAASPDPATIMAECARLTGHAEMPPLWSFGYQQSHRTLASCEEVLQEADTFRQKKLPCDALIYLGTGFCPSGWNTENGSFAWNARVFPDPKEVLDQLHAKNFHAVLHAVILSDRLHGTVRDQCDLSQFDETQTRCYWDAHRKDFAMGVDGWWPDEGDPLDIASRLVRNRMYWEGPQLDRPNERPYALHRNGYAGMQRYGSFLWSGDVYSKWETLKTQIPIAINTGLSGIPYWGTDIGGFVPTPEFTAELYVRWFQFGAFCTLFRSHGRTWKLRLPWGWNTGDPGPVEIKNYDGAAIPDSSQLHNPDVERICRKYLELRYRMLPYLYSAVRECAVTGMPIMRGLWLHFPDDSRAVSRDDEYMWGGNLLVAPVVEKAAALRRVYLPHDAWYDFWSGERIEGSREFSRPVNLETLPLYVRAGSILPLGPVRQHVAEKSDQPLSITVYPGRDASFLLYEDDGTSFNYRKGDWMGIQMDWNESGRTLSLRLAEGSRMLPPLRRDIEIRVVTGGAGRKLTFDGQPIKVGF
ncbi:MAG TPA: TIM-barrel domain-containing protein [Terriglobales bacterium]|nr:TIM-barrel domain-containing protein [Terriglobales bacterium]